MEGGILLQVEPGEQAGHIVKASPSVSHTQASNTYLHGSEDAQIEIWRELIREKEKVLEEKRNEPPSHKQRMARKELQAEIEELWGKIWEEAKHKKQHQDIDDSAFIQGGLTHRATAHLVNKASEAPCKAGVLCKQVDGPAFTLFDEAQTHRVNQLARIVNGRIVNGTILMNRTLMLEKALPYGAKHTNTKTVASDWMSEYPSNYNAPPPVVRVVSAPAPEPPRTSTVGISGESVAFGALTLSGGILGALHWLA